jgi:hypothetical protein
LGADADAAAADAAAKPAADADRSLWNIIPVRLKPPGRALLLLLLLLVLLVLLVLLLLVLLRIGDSLTATLAAGGAAAWRDPSLFSIMPVKLKPRRPVKLVRSSCARKRGWQFRPRQVEREKSARARAQIAAGRVDVVG